MVVFTVLVFAFTACGGGMTGDNSSNGQSAQTGKQENATESEKIELTVSESTPNLSLKNFWDMCVNKFREQYPNYNLTMDWVPTSGPEEYYKTKIAAGEFSDVARVFQPAILIDGNIVQELPQELQDMLIDPGFVKVKGKIYMMPNQLGALGIWYNKDMFKTAGIEKVPETWSEYIDACKKLKNAGFEAMGMAVKEGWYIAGYFDMLWSPVTYGADPDWPKNRTEGKVKFNNSVSRRSLEQLQETIPYWQQGAMSATYDQIKSLFYTGKVAMMCNGGVYNAAELDSGEVNPEFEIGYMLPPQDDASARRVNTFKDQLWTINSNAKDEKLQACVDFLKFFFSKGVYEEFLTANCALPTVKGFESFVPNVKAPKAKIMLDEINAAVQKFRTVAHAHAAQGDNMWPDGCREMSEKMVQELAAGNSDFDKLLNLMDGQWDKGIVK